MKLSEQLKKETHFEHQELEKNSTIFRLVSPSLTINEYKFILKKYYEIYFGLEKQVEHHLSPFFEYQCKYLWLRDDLQKLGDNIVSIDSAFPYKLHSFDDVVGAVYVLEGATLGGRVILRNIQNNLPTVPTCYLEGYGQRTKSQWLLFLDFLEVLSDTVDHKQVINSAKLTFGLFDEFLSR